MNPRSRVFANVAVRRDGGSPDAREVAGESLDWRARMPKEEPEALIAAELKQSGE